MRFARTISIAVLGCALAGGAAGEVKAAPPASCTARAEGGPTVAYGLTVDQRITCFKVNRPAVSETLIGVRNLTAPDTAVLAIDVRPSNGALYALGNAGGLYVADLSEGRLDFKARVTVPLDGRNFGVDFNPTVDRLRIVSDTGQNLRVNVDTGAATVDGFLRSSATRVSGVGAVAYTNNDNDASTATTLFDIDTVGDQLTSQAPPNDGVLVSVGRLGFQGNSAAAFDIWSAITDGKAIENRGFAVLDGGGAFFSIDLTTGQATFIGITNSPLTGLAFPI